MQSMRCFPFLGSDHCQQLSHGLLQMGKFNDFPPVVRDALLLSLSCNRITWRAIKTQIAEYHSQNSGPVGLRRGRKCAVLTS